MEALSNGPLARLWELAAFKDQLRSETVSQIDIHATIDALKSARDLPLPVAGELLHALSRVLDSSTDLALEDAKETNRELYKTFKDQISVNDGGEIDRSTTSATPPMETGLELGDLSLPESLLGRKHQVAPEDISIDAIVREDRSMDEGRDAAGNVLEEVPQRSAGELEALEALDLGGDEVGDDAQMSVNAPGDMFDFPTMPESDEAGLDFGSDLPNSSSPPHTPRADEEINVRIEHSSSPAAALVEEVPRKRAPRRHGAPVDDVISISRPTKPSAQILRSINPIPRPEPRDAEDSTFIPLDDATERLVDPAYVQAEMKRRRLSGETLASQSLSDLDSQLQLDAAAASFPLPDEHEDGMDLGADWGMDVYDSDGEPSRIQSDSEGSERDEESFNEPEDTAEALQEGAAAAKAVLHSHLRKKGAVVKFDELASSAQTRADTLMELLALAAKGRVAPHQDGPWEPITITQL